MKPVEKLRTVDDIEQHFCDRPEEIDDYLAEIFQELSLSINESLTRLD